jgi:hypothetical protein
VQQQHRAAVQKPFQSGKTRYRRQDPQTTNAEHSRVDISAAAAKTDRDREGKSDGAVLPG